MKQQFLQSTADTFQTYVYEFNRKIVPTSATITIYNPGTTTKVVDGASMTVAGDGLLSYSLTTSHTDTVDQNYKVSISYVYNAITYTATLFMDVVKVKLHKVITDQDIVDELPQLRENGWRVHGVSESGSTTTIVDGDLNRFPDDYFTGGLAYSATQDETREITDFVSSTGTVTTTAFTATAATDKYILTQPFTREINRAFEKIEELLNRTGKRAHLILDPYDLREVHILFAVAEVCKGMTKEGEGSIWWEFWQHYDKRGYAVFHAINFKYDESEDGYISGGEENRRVRRRIVRG